MGGWDCGEQVCTRVFWGTFMRMGKPDLRGTGVGSTSEGGWRGRGRRPGGVRRVGGRGAQTTGQKGPHEGGGGISHQSTACIPTGTKVMRENRLEIEEHGHCYHESQKFIRVQYRCKKMESVSQSDLIGALGWVCMSEYVCVPSLTGVPRPVFHISPTYPWPLLPHGQTEVSSHSWVHTFSSSLPITLTHFCSCSLASLSQFLSLPPLPCALQLLLSWLQFVLLLCSITHLKHLFFFHSLCFSAWQHSFVFIFVFFFLFLVCPSVNLFCLLEINYMYVCLFQILILSFSMALSKTENGFALFFTIKTAPTEQLSPAS